MNERIHQTKERKRHGRIRPESGPSRSRFPKTQHRPLQQQRIRSHVQGDEGVRHHRHLPFRRADSRRVRRRHAQVHSTDPLPRRPHRRARRGAQPHRRAPGPARGRREAEFGINPDFTIADGEEIKFRRDHPQGHPHARTLQGHADVLLPGPLRLRGHDFPRRPRKDLEPRATADSRSIPSRTRSSPWPTIRSSTPATGRTAPSRRARRKSRGFRAAGRPGPDEFGDVTWD